MESLLCLLVLPYARMSVSSACCHATRIHHYSSYSNHSFAALGRGRGGGRWGGRCRSGPIASTNLCNRKKKNEIKLPFSSLVPLLKTLTGQRVLTVPDLLHSMMDMPIARMPPHLRKSVQHLNQERSLPNVVMLCEECSTRLSRPPVYSPCFFFFKWRTEKKDILGPATRGNLFATPANAGEGRPPPPRKN